MITTRTEFELNTGTAEFQAAIKSCYYKKLEDAIKYAYNNRVFRRIATPSGYRNIDHYFSAFLIAIQEGLALPKLDAELAGYYQEFQALTRNNCPVYWVDKTLLDALANTDLMDRMPPVKLPLEIITFAFPVGQIADNLKSRHVSFLQFLECDSVDGRPGVWGRAWVEEGKLTPHYTLWVEKGQTIPKPPSCKFADKQEVLFWYQVFSLGIKLLLLLSSRPSLIQEGAVFSRKKGINSLPSKKIDEIWSPNWIGKNYQMKGGNGEREGRSPRAHIVRGHFHTYRCGPGRSETKINWIEPYWKGVNNGN